MPGNYHFSVDTLLEEIGQAWGEGIRSVLLFGIPDSKDEVGSEAYDYKLEWLRRLRACLDRDHTPSEPVVVCGDFNVAPEARDVADPPVWEGSVLFHPEVREALQGVLSWGLTDVFRQHHDEPGLYSWWDYRMLAFPKNKGLRIDHIFASQPLASRCMAASNRGNRMNPSSQSCWARAAGWRGLGNASCISVINLP